MIKWEDKDDVILKEPNERKKIRQLKDMSRKYFIHMSPRKRKQKIFPRTEGH